MKHSVSIQQIMSYDDERKACRIKLILDGHEAYVTVYSTFIDESVQEGSAYTTEDFKKICKDGKEVEVPDGTEEKTTVETYNELLSWSNSLGYDNEYEKRFCDAFDYIIEQHNIDL